MDDWDEYGDGFEEAALFEDGLEEGYVPSFDREDDELYGLFDEEGDFEDDDEF